MTIGLLTAAIGALSAAIVALATAYLWPPTGSVVALKRRMAALEADHEANAALVQRLKKRHYALEGHVYGSDDDDEDQGPAEVAQPGSDPATAAGPLVPADFPEAEFQDQLARRRASRIGG